MSAKKPEPVIASITAGGAGMFCGSCLRDNALAFHLRERGVPITLVPTFTPITTDEEDASLDRVFLGGVNVYLADRWPLLGRLPRPLRRVLDHPILLRAVSRLALQTRREEDGRVALSLLRGADGHQASEIADLVDWLATELRPDLVQVTNLLIAGFVPRLLARTDVPVLATLQGDDVFLDSLLPADREAVLTEMRRLGPLFDGFVTFSSSYRDAMSGLFELPPAAIRVVPLGLAGLEEFAPPREVAERPPTLGYLARICPEKGFDVLVDAWLRVRQKDGGAAVRLRAAGWLGARDRPFFDRCRARIEAAGALQDFTLVDIPDRPSKIAFLHSVDVFSVPSPSREPKGLFLLEALAAGRPVVQPDHGSSPEILARTGGGELVPPGEPEALAGVLSELLRLPPARRRALGEEGRRGVERHHSMRAMADATLDIWREHVDSHEPRAGG